MRTLGVLAVAAACAQPAATPAPQPRGPSALLTAAAPAVAFDLAALSSKPHQLVITITSLNNPSRAAFAVRAGFDWSTAGKAGHMELGLVAPYPPDRAGRYALALSEAAVAALTAHSGKLGLRLEPIGPAPLAGSLRAEIAPPSFR